MAQAQLTKFGVHGSEAQVELAPDLDPDHIDVQKRGWGTVLTVPDLRLISGSDRSVWFHLAITTPLSLEDFAQKVTKVRPSTDPEPADAMSVWDGSRLIKAWDDQRAHPPTLDHGAWPVNSKLETGLGLSLKWTLPNALGGDASATTPFIITIFGAWAMFESVFEAPPLH